MQIKYYCTTHQAHITMISGMYMQITLIAQKAWCGLRIAVGKMERGAYSTASDNRPEPNPLDICSLSFLRFLSFLCLSDISIKEKELDAPGRLLTL